MERYIKIAAPGAVIGLIMSLLMGIIAGVGFGTVILRSILSGAIFGIGGVGLYIAVERFLPELLEATGGDTGSQRSTSEAATGRSDDSPPGGTVDIVVEDEDETDGEVADEQDSETASGTESPREPDGDDLTADGDDLTADDDAALEPPAASAETSAGTMAAPAASAESGEESESAEEDGLAGWTHADAVEPSPPASGDDEGEEEDAEELVEEVEERTAENAEALMNEAIAEQKYGSGVEIDDSVLDQMPDIGAFSGAFVEPTEGSEEADSDAGAYAEFSGGGSSHGGGSSRGGGGGSKAAGNDPAMIAKALKTMLSRDGKE